LRVLAQAPSPDDVQAPVTGKIGADVRGGELAGIRDGPQQIRFHVGDTTCRHDIVREVARRAASISTACRRRAATRTRLNVHTRRIEEGQSGAAAFGYSDQRLGAVDRAGGVLLEDREE